MRLGILDRLAVETDVTTAIGEFLVERNLLEPWPLTFDVDGQPVGFTDLLVVRTSAFDDASLAPLVAQYGLPCATVLGLHRVSLFRAGSLLAAAKSFISTAKAETSEGSSHRDRLATAS
jgi:hypothetical protein